MKKVLISLFFYCITFCINAQVFNYKQVLDKFDDAISEGYQKTLISHDDSIIIIEEKGHKAVEYRIENLASDNCLGSIDNIVNLVNNVYGYQECWAVVKSEDYKSYLAEYFDVAYQTPNEAERTQKIKEMILKYYHYITHRVVVEKYTHAFDAQYWWVTPANEKSEISRTVYCNK